MAGEDQERFEDYLELEHFIEELQAGRVAHPPEGLSPSKASIYRMAALFRSASPGEAEPRLEFAAELQARLEREVQGPLKAQPFPFLSKRPRKKPRVSRRALLAGGAAIAASLAVGAGIERAAESIGGQHGSTPAQGGGNGATTALVPPDIKTTWFPVTTVAALGDKAVKFVANNIVGYVIYDDGDDGDRDKGEIIAMSAACTHMGCIVNWSAADRKFHCPCHGGVFSEYGEIDNHSTWIRYLAPLPRLETKVEDGKIYVKVPAGQASTT